MQAIGHKLWSIGPHSLLSLDAQREQAYRLQRSLLRLQPPPGAAIWRLIVAELRLGGVHQHAHDRLKLNQLIFGLLRLGHELAGELAADPVPSEINVLEHRHPAHEASELL